MRTGLTVSTAIALGIGLGALAHAADDKFMEHPIDGVYVEAVETYQNPKTKAIEVSLGLWPLNPYFNALSLDLGYKWIFDRTFAAEIRGSYMYSVDKGLTSELADSYGVDPKTQIERPNFLGAADVYYTLAYGKFIFSKKYIRYFRSQALAGAAFVETNKRSTVGADLGWTFEAYVNDRFSWKLELRDVVAAIGSTTNNLEISVGTNYAF